MEKSTRIIFTLFAAMIMLLTASCNRVVVRERTVPLTGHVCFDVQPASATVYVDGQAVGMANQFTSERGCLELPTGRHIVTVVKKNFVAYEQEIQVGPGSQHLYVKLSPARGRSGAHPPRRHNAPVKVNPPARENPPVRENKPPTKAKPPDKGKAKSYDKAKGSENAEGNDKAGNTDREKDKDKEKDKGQK